MTKGKGGGKIFKDNGLTIVFVGLFLAALIGQSICGFHFYNDQRASDGFSPVSYREFLRTGTFLDALFCNWQAAILQLGSLIIFGSVLYQRGASHSRDPERHGDKKRLRHHPSHRRKKRRRNWLYRNSLSLAFTGLFLIAFILHIIFGAAGFNETRDLQGQNPLSKGEFFISAKFWFLTFQTWEAEFFTIAVFIVLTIFLRQEKSSESKPTDASDEKTGEPNE